MPNALVQAAARGLPKLNRRHLLKGAVAGAAAALPAVAEAHPALTDEEQLDACISSLRSILARMHPDVDEVKSVYSPMPDDGYIFSLVGHAPKIKWSGPGFYEIRERRHDKYTAVLWVDEIWSHLDNCYGYRAHALEGGRQVGVSSYFTRSSLYIVRKIEGTPA